MQKQQIYMQFRHGGDTFIKTVTTNDFLFLVKIIYLLAFDVDFVDTSDSSNAYSSSYS